MTVQLSASDLLAITTVIEEYLGTPECIVGLDQEYMDRIDGIAQAIDEHLGLGSGVEVSVQTALAALAIDQ